jgi:hypothetical protein
VKKIAIALLLASSMLAFAGDKPKELTVQELKLQLAQKDLQIASLKQQLLDKQALINVLSDPRYQVQKLQNDADKKAAQQAIDDATPKPEP